MFGRKKLGATTTVTKTTKPGQRARMAKKGFFPTETVSSESKTLFQKGKKHKGTRVKTTTTYVRKNAPTDMPLIGPPSGYTKPKKKGRK